MTSAAVIGIGAGVAPAAAPATVGLLGTLIAMPGRLGQTEARSAQEKTGEKQRS